MRTTNPYSLCSLALPKTISPGYQVVVVATVAMDEKIYKRELLIRIPRKTASSHSESMLYIVRLDLVAKDHCVGWLSSPILFGEEKNLREELDQGVSLKTSMTYPNWLGEL